MRIRIASGVIKRESMQSIKYHSLSNSLAMRIRTASMEGYQKEKEHAINKMPETNS
jgi:hypothetical protein